MKKGQAAMEFLMTYGWAILVVLAAIAALAYFGVLDLGRILPEQCTSAGGLTCVDKPVITAGSAGAGTIQVAVANNVGRSVSLAAASVEGATDDDCEDGTAGLEFDGPGGTAGDGNDTAITTWQNNAQNVITITCDDALTAGDRISTQVVLSYTDSETGLTHPVTFDITGRAN